MTVEITICSAKIDNVDDIAAISSVGQASFRTAYENYSEPDDLIEHLEDYFSEAAVRTAMQAQGCQYLLARNGSQVAGFVKISDCRHPDEVPATKSLELSQVYVLPDQQRYGIGGRLLAAAAAYARKQAADGIWLTVWEDAPWAVNCYRKYGFEQVGMIDFQLGKTIYNDLLMWRPVKESAAAGDPD